SPVCPRTSSAKTATSGFASSAPSSPEVRAARAELPMSVSDPKPNVPLLSGLATLDDVEVENQRVLLRADLDVPADKRGEVLAGRPVRRVSPTIQRAVEPAAVAIVASAFGSSRPDAEGDAPSIEPAAARLSELSGFEVYLPDDAVGGSVIEVINDL